jgi:SAM-dependent methyltransferase
VPGADVRRAVAGDLPWIDATFDLVVSQLVLNFLPDPQAGVAEMLRVVRVDGTVAACTWDYAHGMTMLRTFWDAARDVDPEAPDEARTMRFTTERELAALWERAGMTDIRTRSLEVSAGYTDFDDYWQPFLLGIGPGGAYAASLDAERLERLRDGCFQRLGAPDGPFTLGARAVAVSGRRAS